MSLASLAARRRTHKAFGPEPVQRETLLELLDVARLAPNHHLTQPWRFRVLGPEALARVKDAQAGEATKLERAPTLVLATAALSGELLQDEEDVCATAAAITLVLLAATERGLATYWRTPAVLRTTRGREAAGVRTANACSRCCISVRRSGNRHRGSANSESYVYFLD